MNAKLKVRYRWRDERPGRRGEEVGRAEQRADDQHAQEQLHHLHARVRGE